MKYEAIVIGLSSGGMNAIKKLLYSLSSAFPAPIIIVQHLGSRSDSTWISNLDQNCKLQVKEADEKEAIIKGRVYIAPPNYHLLIEKDKTFSLTIGEKVNFARPSIDLLFESAADAYTQALIGVVLTGSNHDGANGLKRIQEKGGFIMVEDPLTAESPGMPASAIALTKPDRILPLDELIKELIRMVQNN